MAEVFRPLYFVRIFPNKKAKEENEVNLQPLQSYVPPVSAPFFQTDWENPEKKKPSQFSESDGRILETPVVASPFHQDIWDRTNPVKYTSKSDFVVNLLPLRGQPFRQSDWVNPQSLKSNNQSFDSFVNLLPLNGEPFKQLNWDLPSSKQFKQESLSYSNYLVLNQQSPFSNFDWSNPSRLLLNQIDTDLYSSIRETPVPPVDETFRQTYFVCNVGRMMNR